jgi:hypothetical protein
VLASPRRRRGPCEIFLLRLLILSFLRIYSSYGTYVGATLAYIRPFRSGGRRYDLVLYTTLPLWWVIYTTLEKFTPFLW